MKRFLYRMNATSLRRFLLRSMLSILLTISGIGLVPWMIYLGSSMRSSEALPWLLLDVTEAAAFLVGAWLVLWNDRHAPKMLSFLSVLIGCDLIVDVASSIPNELAGALILAPIELATSAGLAASALWLSRSRSDSCTNPRLKNFSRYRSQSPFAADNRRQAIEFGARRIRVIRGVASTVTTSVAVRARSAGRPRQTVKHFTVRDSAVAAIAGPSTVSMPADDVLVEVAGAQDVQTSGAELAADAHGSASVQGVESGFVVPAAQAAQSAQAAQAPETAESSMPIGESQWVDSAESAFSDGTTSDTSASFESVDTEEVHVFAHSGAR